MINFEHFRDENKNSFIEIFREYDIDTSKYRTIIVKLFLQVLTKVSLHIKVSCICTYKFNILQQVGIPLGKY